MQSQSSIKQSILKKVMIDEREQETFQSGGKALKVLFFYYVSRTAQEKLQSLVTLYTQGKYQEMLTQTTQLLKNFPLPLYQQYIWSSK